jgi:hypothetical protein
LALLNIYVRKKNNISNIFFSKKELYNMLDN